MHMNVVKTGRKNKIINGGGTPIIELSRYAEAAEVKDVTLLGKLEYFNPAGSAVRK